MSALKVPIPITVITGFLGSGKTTLLSAVLKKKEMRNTAVIINEFGEIGLDHALVEKSDENIVEMQNGCICCTIRDDLHKTLLDIVDKVSKKQINPFDRILIETTGLADPVPIIHTLMTSVDLQRVFKLAGVLTVVDAVNGEDTLNAQKESVKQVALAEHVILSKTDLAKDGTQSLMTRIKAINPSADITVAIQGHIPVSTLLGLESYDPYDKSEDVKDWLASEKYDKTHHHHHDHNINRHGEDIKAFCMKSDVAVTFEAFNFFLNLLTAICGADLLRLKGIINVSGKNYPAVIHGVQHIFHPVKWLNEWPDEDHSTRIVCITRHFQKEKIEELFQTLFANKELNIN